MRDESRVNNGHDHGDEDKKKNQKSKILNSI